MTSSEYYQRNREKILKQTKEKYLENKEKYLQYQREYRRANRELINSKSKAKRTSRLLKAIEILGGKCFRCGQTYDPVCYDFHHNDPKEKEVTIGENMLISEERFFTEIRKCTLLCSNCHRITHKELRNES